MGRHRLSLLPLAHVGQGWRTGRGLVGDGGAEEAGVGEAGGLEEEADRQAGGKTAGHGD